METRNSACFGDTRRDLIVALRSFRRDPGFVFACVAVLAVAIGANAAVFSVLHALVLQSLPYADADRTVVLWTSDARRGVTQEGVSIPNFEDWRRMNRSFAEMSYFVRTETEQATLTGDAPKRVRIGSMAPDCLRLLGVLPLRGRFYSGEDVTEVLISERLWMERFGGSESAIGSRLGIEERSATVAGVMPREFQFPYEGVDVWVPPARYNLRPADRYNDFVAVVARLRSGVTLEAARKDMAHVGALLANQHPDAPKDFAGFGVTVVPMYEHIYGATLRRAIWTLFAAVLVLLLIGCGNAANLLLARAEARRHEFAIRSALGAGAGRILRQMIAESAVLAMVASVAGLVLAGVALRVLVHWAGAVIPRLDQATLRWEVIAWTVALAVVTCVGCAVPPAWRAHTESSRAPGGSRFTFERRSRAAMNSLVVGQVALAMVLCAAGGLLLRSFIYVQSASLGYREPERVLVFHVSSASRDPVLRLLLQDIRALPGVSAAESAAGLFIERNPDLSVTIDGVRHDGFPLTDDRVTAGFFTAMGVRLLRGRFFTPEEEQAVETPAAIINHSMAAQYWPGQDPVGRTFLRGRSPKRVVGIVDDMKLRGRERGAVAQMFFPLRDATHARVVVRSAADPRSLVEPIHERLRRISAGAVMYDVGTVTGVLDRIQLQRNLQTALATLFSGIAVCLALFGVCSLLHFTSSKRVREFAIRAALGADRWRLLRLVMRQGGMLALAGVGIGLAASAAVMRLLSSLLFGVGPYDAVTLAAAAMAVVAVIVAASLVPAWRFSAVNPATGLRAE